MKEYDRYDATGLAELVQRGEVSPAELLETAQERSSQVEPRINAIAVPMAEQARRQLQAGVSGPFAGVPFLIKDIQQDYAGVPTTSGSRAARNWMPAQHSTVVSRFLAAGLVIFGKTTTPELALKASTETLRHGATRNPWDLQRTPGGSSGGAAAAVAAGVVPMAGGSDGGGSIRIPASFCGLFGLRPSRGRVPSGPHEGEIWEGASSEHVLTRSVRDSARMLDAIAGADRGAPFVIAPPERAYAQEPGRDPGRLRIGFMTRSPLRTAVDEDCIAAVEDAARLLASLGHEIEPAEPQIDGAELGEAFITMYFGNVAASVAELCARSGGSEKEFEPDTRLLAQIGRALGADRYVHMRRCWNRFARALGEFHTRYDLLLTPTVAAPPARIGEMEPPLMLKLGMNAVLRARAGGLLQDSRVVRNQLMSNLQRTPFTQLSNLTGTPSMSVPLYWTVDDMPVGVQFVARFGEEGLLLRLAAQLEQARPWAQRRPAFD